MRVADEVRAAECHHAPGLVLTLTYTGVPQETVEYPPITTVDNFLVKDVCERVSLLSPVPEPTATPTPDPTGAPTPTAVLYLYDLRDDPNEATNLIDTYNGSLSGMLSRAGDTVVSRYSPSLAGRTQAMARCGGVCPWEPEGPDDFRWEIERKYNVNDGAEGPSKFEPPHIVLTLVDDWGWNDFGTHSDYMSWTTPNLDLLASEGIELTFHFVAWVCAPSRASLLSGLYTTHTGFWSGVSTLRVNETLLPQELQAAGYKVS